MIPEQHNKVTLAVLAVAAILAVAVIAGPVQARTISVVMDNNYPPYIFPDSTGRPQGILIDQWHLWEQKTGHTANITATDWADALRRMDAGEFDVIDTIFFSDARKEKYDFGKPYATLDVPLFFHRDISGISGPESVEGFIVAVKSGDYAVDYLKSRGVTSLREYPSYEAIVNAAADGEVVVFCIDKPPALYFLYKRGLQDQFRQTAPLYVGQFHRAVRKGDAGTLSLVESGFDSISTAEYDSIDRRWLGSPLISPEYLRYFAVAIAGVLVMFFIVFYWNRTLQKKVDESTARLREEVRISTARAEALKESEERYRHLFVQNPAPILIYERGTLRLLAVNEAFRRYYGYTGDEALNMVLSDLYPEEEKDPEAMFAARVRGGARAGEWHHRKKDGTFMTVVAYSHDILYEGKEARIAVITDITELKKTSTALELARKKLNLLNTVTFQDIQNAVFGLASYLELTRMATRDDLTKSYLEKGLGIIRNLSQVLDFSKKYQSMGIHPPAWQNVERVFLYALSHLPPLDAEHNISVGGLEIYADPLLETAIGILVESMVQPGTGATALALRCEVNGNMLTLILEDNGNGIPAKDKETLFSPERGQGPGSDLVLAGEILSITGITIRETGTEGKGTRFAMTVPPGAFRFSDGGTP